MWNNSLYINFKYVLVCKTNAVCWFRCFLFVPQKQKASVVRKQSYFPVVLVITGAWWIGLLQASPAVVCHVRRAPGGHFVIDASTMLLNTYQRLSSLSGGPIFVLFLSLNLSNLSTTVFTILIRCDKSVAPMTVKKEPMAHNFDEVI